ncbi:hypothetical protein B9Z55_028297 [Caenorhabditis nigoni]|uniref:Receptor expression-enhancing protein n=1 Tax=Caenorhabditis nigoni TaxID=1611254 RepID=A0A2G5SC58_9PELO|nr:hypothetical protein B9Z55_028297 [Caenorhabditis nigoni]
MSFLARGLSNLIGIVAPVVHSFKVLKKPTKPKLIQCLHFWTIYGSFLITDWFLTTFFISCFIPFYDFFCLSFVVLLSAPHLGFASMLYTKFLAPFLRKYERRIDNVTSTVMNKVWEKLPAVAMTAPALLASVANALNSSEVAVERLEVEEIDSSIEFIQHRRPASRSVSRSRNPRLLNPIQIAPAVDQDFEMQEEEESDENDENDGGDVFYNLRDREVKQEVLDDEDFAPRVVPSPRAAASGLRSRPQTRSRSMRY